MVNGNYVVQEDKSVHHPERLEGGTRGPDRKRRLFRSANELDASLQSREPSDVESNNNTAERKKNGEPNLLKYSFHGEKDDIKKPETRNGDVSPRRQSFTKRPKNPSDGSYNYARSSGNGSPTSSNLAPIAENTVADSFELMADYNGYRARSSFNGSDKFNSIPGSNVSELIPSYNNGHKFDTSKYFSNSTDDKKFAAKGTHPDSLYRVTLHGTEQARSVLFRCYRMLRWPLALLAVCLALALFIYYVMPDSAETDLLDTNSTVWEAGFAGKYRHRPRQRSKEDNVFGETTETTGVPDDSDMKPTKTAEIDFDSETEEVKKSFQEILQAEVDEAKKPVPIFPERVTPVVQYGNEKTYPGTDRTPKVIQSGNVESTLRPPYRLTKGDFALDIHDDITSKSSDSYNEKQDDPIRYLLPHEIKRNFTSGHSKLFGISIEDAARYETTPNSLYNTRVSPTLPAMPRNSNKLSVSSTTRRNDVDDELACRSTNLEMCRKILPYDLTTGPVLPISINQTELDMFLVSVEGIMSMDICSVRLAEFLCYLLEPECTSSVLSVRKPCRNLCLAVELACEYDINHDALLKNLTDCSIYPEENCIGLKEPCQEGELSCNDGTCFPAGSRCDYRKDCSNGLDELDCDSKTCNSTQYKCPQSGGCIPKHWLCDGYADCTNGEDEFNCTLSDEGFVPQTLQTHISIDKLPKWLQALAGNVQHEAAESMINPQLHLPKNAVPKPSKVEIARVMETAKMHDQKGDFDNSKELLMMSDSTNRAKPIFKAYNKVTPKPRQREFQSPLVNKAMEEMIGDLEKMADAEKWWEHDAEPESIYERSGTAHASPCPTGELRCVDGRCIMFSQLCDGHVDCTDNADEDNCSV